MFKLTPISVKITHVGVILTARGLFLTSSIRNEDKDVLHNVLVLCQGSFGTEGLA